MSFASQEQALQSYVYVYSRLGQEVMPLSFSPLHSLLSERTDTCETVDRVGLAATDCESPAVYRSVSRPVVAAQSRRWLRLDHAFMQWLGPCIAVPALSPTCHPHLFAAPERMGSASGTRAGCRGTHPAWCARPWELPEAEDTE